MVRRGAATLGAIAAALVASSCGGSESSSSSELCQSLRGVQSSVKEIRAIELSEGAVDELEHSVAKLRSTLASAEEAAGEDLGDEFASVRSSLGALGDDLQALATDDDITPAEVSALAPLVSTSVDSLRALGEAAPDCNLDI